MTLYGIVCVTFLFIITSLLTIGGFVIQRDKYWMRIWNELGKPEIKSIKELKAYSNKYSCQNLPPLLDQSHLGLRSK